MVSPTLYVVCVRPKKGINKRKEKNKTKKRVCKVLDNLNLLYVKYIPPYILRPLFTGKVRDKIGLFFENIINIVLMIFKKITNNEAKVL